MTTLSGQAPRKLAFYYPSRVMGGAEMLLVRTIRALSAKGVACDLWDYADGFTANALKERAVSFRHVVCDECRTPPPDALAGYDVNDALIVFQTQFFLIPELPASRCKILVWELHKSFWLKLPDALRQRVKMERSATLLRHGALAVLETDSIAWMRRAGLSPDAPPIVPIAVEATGHRRVFTDGKEPSFVSIGRATPDKLIGPMWAFARIAKKHPAARLSFITNDTERARMLAERTEPEIAGRTDFIGGLSGEALDVWLVENADVYLGMGTTLLEAGKLGIPAVIVDGTEGDKYPGGARVRMLSENDGANLGAPEPSATEGRTLDETIDAILRDIRGAGAETLAYVRTRHMPDAAAEALIAAVSRASLPLDTFASDADYRRTARSERRKIRFQCFRRAIKARFRNLFGSSR